MVQTKEEKDAYQRQYKIDNKEETAAYNKQYRIANKEEKAAYMKQYRIANKEKITQTRIKNREQLTTKRWKKQGVKCDDFPVLFKLVQDTTHCNRCNVLLTTGKQCSTTRVMDHNHETGLFRNVLCCNCNLNTPELRSNFKCSDIL
tara:strand:+ start:477 stop:914 length:438 start_codon:yes stop_codon:yes gene_type:complete